MPRVVSTIKAWSSVLIASPFFVGLLPARQGLSDYVGGSMEKVTKYRLYLNRCCGGGVDHQLLSIILISPLGLSMSQGIWARFDLPLSYIYLLVWSTDVLKWHVQKSMVKGVFPLLWLYTDHTVCQERRRINRLKLKSKNSAIEALALFHFHLSKIRKK